MKNTSKTCIGLYDKTEAYMTLVTVLVVETNLEEQEL